MPWVPADAIRHDKQANTKAKRRKWSAIANAILSKTGDDVLAIKTANARTEALDRAPLLFEMEKTQFIPWSSMPTDLDTPRLKTKTVAKMPDWLKDEPKPRAASDASTRIIKTARERGDSTATKTASLPTSWPEEAAARAKTGEAREKAARFRRAVQDAAEFAKEMASPPPPPPPSSPTSLTRTPLVLKTKELPTPVQHVTKIIDALSKAGKPIPDSLKRLLAGAVANEAKWLKRTPLSGR